MTLAIATRNKSALASRETAQLIEASISENTQRAYTGALRRLDEAIPYALNDLALTDYLTTMYWEGKSPSAISIVVAAVKFRAKLHGEPSPVGPITERTLAGIRRMGSGRGRGQVKGVQWREADAACIIAENDGSLAGLRDAALVAMMSDALLRVSELAALNVADVNLEEQTVLIRRSKTDQVGEGAVQFLGEPTCNRLRAYMNAAGISEGVLFTRIRRGGIPAKGSRLNPSSVRRIIAKRCKVVAGEEGRVSGHSLRVGSAQSLASAGASLVEMQLAGRWSSPAMPGRYAQGQLAKRGAVARLRYGNA